MATPAPPDYAIAILYGMQGQPIYQGTVSNKTKNRRRAKNRVARKSRRANR